MTLNTLKMITSIISEANILITVSPRVFTLRDSQIQISVKI